MVLRMWRVVPARGARGVMGRSGLAPTGKVPASAMTEVERLTSECARLERDLYVFIFDAAEPFRTMEQLASRLEKCMAERTNLEKELQDGRME